MMFLHWKYASYSVEDWNLSVLVRLIIKNCGFMSCANRGLWIRQYYFGYFSLCIKGTIGS